MLIQLLKSIRLTTGNDRGFTLIEVLVAMVSGVIVTGALFSILDISLHQTSLITDKVQANQLGRTAMTRVIDELHSSCLSPGFTPIREKSSATTLWFINAYSNEAIISTATAAKVSGTGAFKHEIIWNKAAGTLTDYTFKSTGGELPNYTFPELTSANATPAGGVLLASNVNQTGSTPIFQYYKYATASSSSESTPVGTLVEQKPPEAGFSAAEAELTAAVLVSFRQLPSDANSVHNRYLDLSNQVTFAFSAPNVEAPIEDAPCE